MLPGCQTNVWEKNERIAGNKMQLKSKLLYIYKSWFVLIHAKLHSDAHLRIVYAGRLRNAGILGQIFIMPFWPDFDYLNFYLFLRVQGGGVYGVGVRGGGGIGLGVIGCFFWDFCHVVCDYSIGLSICGTSIHGLV